MLCLKKVSLGDKCDVSERILFQNSKNVASKIHTLDFLRFLSSENRTFLDQNRHVYFLNAIFGNLLVQQRDILVPRGRLVLQKILLREEKCHLYCPFSSSNFVQFLRQFSTP